MSFLLPELWFSCSYHQVHHNSKTRYLSADVLFASYKLWSCISWTTTTREQVTVHTTLKHAQLHTRHRYLFHYYIILETSLSR